MKIRFLGQSGYLLKTENTDNSEDPHLFSDHIDGGRVLAFNKWYNWA